MVFPRVRAYKDFRHKTEIVPMVTYENAWVRVFGPGLEFKLGQAGPVAFGLTLGYGADEGYQAKDSPTLAGMAGPGDERNSEESRLPTTDVAQIQQTVSALLQQGVPTQPRSRRADLYLARLAELDASAQIEPATVRALYQGERS